MKAIKSEQRYNLGQQRNDEKPKEETNKLR